MKYPAPDSDFAAVLNRLQISTCPSSPWQGVAASKTVPNWAEQTGRWETLLRSCANPAVCIRLASNEAGEGVWREAFLVSNGSWALLTREGRESTLEGIDNLAQGWERALRAVGWDYSGSDCGQITLSLPAYAALLASADTVHAGHARAYLARKAPARPVLTAEFLEEELAAGLAAEDTHWCVTAAARLRPELLQACRGRLQAGLKEMEELKLTQPVQRGSALSEAGERLAEPLTHLKATLHVDDGHLGFSLFMGEHSGWMAEIGDKIQVRSPADLHSLAHRLAKAGPACAKCQCVVPAGARFCTKCGHTLARVCGKCSRPAADGDRFCGGCGNSLG